MKVLLIAVALVLVNNAMAQEIDGRFILKSGSSKCPQEIVAISAIFSNRIEVLVETYYDSSSTQKTYKSGSSTIGKTVTETSVKGGVITENIYKKTLLAKKLIHSQMIAIKPLSLSLGYDLILQKNDVLSGEEIECKFVKL
ncbi:MAG: hypothetical protein ACOVP4_01545 [Bacteriovoracaceae bacterium]